VYVHPDFLGSVRMLTGEKTVTSTAPALECYDYLPFGRLLNSGDDARNTGCYPASPDTQITSRLPQKFTGEERDPETRLDYFGARYMSAAEGRFLSADPPLIDQDPSDPQSWNLYTYARNNPLIFIDPTGQDCIYSDEFELNGTVSVAPGDCRRKHGLQVNGSIEVDSISYNPNTKLLQYGFTNENGIGFGYLGLERQRGDELDVKGLAFIANMDARVDASNKMLAGFPTVSLAGTATVAGVPYIAANSIGWGYAWIGGGTGVVLGPWRAAAGSLNYVQTARAIGANAYNVPTWLWQGLNYFGESWTANRAFLQMSIWRGQQFFMSAETESATGTFARELQYLISKGIRPNQWIRVMGPF
jgi:RHS repeat-associated protein